MIYAGFRGEHGFNSPQLHTFKDFKQTFKSATNLVNTRVVALFL
jgi:hypothetical protein